MRTCRLALRLACATLILCAVPAIPEGPSTPSASAGTKRPRKELKRAKKRIKKNLRTVEETFTKGPRAAFVELCEEAYDIADHDIRGSGAAMPLTAWQRRELYPFFGSLLDRVAIHYQARMQQFRLFGKNLGVSPEAQTFGHRIYLKAGPAPTSPHQLALLGHELVHALQAERGDFKTRYCKELYDADYQYARNQMEVEAFQFQSVFLASLLRKQQNSNDGLAWAASSSGGAR